MPTVPVEDGKLWYEERGTGVPMICLHGGWGNADAWQPQVDSLTDEFRIVRVALRGHGESGPTDAREYSIDLFADDLERVIAHLGIEQPILNGVSIGGMITQEFLDRHPNRARAAIISGPLQTMPPTDIPPALKPFLSPVPAITVMLSMVGPTATFQSLLNSIRLATGGPWLATDPSVRSQAVGAVKQVSPAEYRKIFRALYDFVPPDLSHVQTPTLILYGEREAPQVKQQGQRLARSLPYSAIQEIPNAGHLVNQDNSLAFNAACRRFIRSATRESVSG